MQPQHLNYKEKAEKFQCPVFFYKTNGGWRRQCETGVSLRAARASSAFQNFDPTLWRWLACKKSLWLIFWLLPKALSYCKKTSFLVKYLKLTWTGGCGKIIIIIGCEFVGNKATPTGPLGGPTELYTRTPGLIFTPRVPIVIWGGERATLWIIANLKPQTTLHMSSCGLKAK